MENFELFDRIINGELRPHKFKSDGKELERMIDKLKIPTNEISKYLEYLDKKGEQYSIIIKDRETGEVLKDEIKNNEFNELIDIDIPPPPDDKAEKYLELVEFEYARNTLSIDEFYNKNKGNSLKEYAIINIQKLKKLWKDIKHYKKLIIKGKELNWEKSDDYVIYISELFLKRIFFYVLELFKPNIEAGFWEENMTLLSFKDVEIVKIIRELDSKILAKKYKEETGYNLPWSVTLFESEREQISNLPNIKDRLMIFKDYLTFWNRTILSNPIFDRDDYIRKTIIPLIENEIKNLEYKISVSLEKENEKNILHTESNENKKTEQNLMTEKENTDLQRAKIKKYLLEHNSDIKDNINLNLNRLAYEIVDELYPEIKGAERRKKKESIRQELMLFKNGKLDL